MADKRMEVTKDVWTLAKTGVPLREPASGFNRELHDSITFKKEFKPETRMGIMSDREYGRLREAVTDLTPYWEGKEVLTETHEVRGLLGAVSMSQEDAGKFELIKDYVVDAVNSHARRELKRECDVERMLYVVDFVSEAFPMRKDIRNPFFMPQLEPSDHVTHDAAERLSFELWAHHIRQSPQRLIGTLLFMPDHGQGLLEAIDTVSPLYAADKLEDWDAWEILTPW